MRSPTLGIFVQVATTVVCVNTFFFFFIIYDYYIYATWNHIVLKARAEMFTVLYFLGASFNSVVSQGVSQVHRNHA